MLHEGAKGVLPMYADRLPCLAKHRLSTYHLIVLPGVCFPRHLLKCLLLILIPLAPTEHPADNISHYFAWAQETTSSFFPWLCHFVEGMGFLVNTEIHTSYCIYLFSKCSSCNIKLLYSSANLWVRIFL